MDEPRGRSLALSYMSKYESEAEENSTKQVALPPGTMHDLKARYPGTIVRLLKVF